MIKMFKEACMGGDKTSSKRIVLFLFSLVAVVMIALQGLFTLAVFVKHAGILKDFEVVLMLPEFVWQLVFGIIGGIALVNGAESALKKPAPLGD